MAPNPEEPPAGPLASDVPKTEDDEDEEEDEEEATTTPNFADLLGPNCIIKRVDKDKNVIGGAKPEEMQHELITRATAQKRLGACAEHVKDMSQGQKLAWAIELKAQANALYAASNFEEAAKLYNECLVAVDLDGTAEANMGVKRMLQLPVCTNLAACMIEMGVYSRCLEICNIALDVDPASWKALYRRGLAAYRLGDHASARPDFEAALARINEDRCRSGLLDEALSAEEREAELRSMADVQRRATVYMCHIRRYNANERSSCKRMFDTVSPQGLYPDRPDPKLQEWPEDEKPIDDSDEAIDALLEDIRGTWWCCRKRKTAKAKAA